MQNILFIHSSAELYGSDRSLYNIIKYLDKSKYTLHVLLPSNGPLAVELKKFPSVKVIIHDIAILRRKNLSFTGFFSYISSLHKSIRFIRDYIKKNEIHIVETNTAVTFPGAIAAKRERIVSLWHIREIIANKYENFFVSFVMNRYSDVIIANSRSTGNALKVNQNKVRIVYNAIEKSEADSEIIQRDSDSITIGMAGRINRWKGQKLFVDAAEQVLKKNSNVKFVIAGEAYTGELYLKEELIRYIKEKKLEKSIKLLGQVTDMSKFYRSIDIFVLPSIQPEPFGLVVIEAMKYSLPVIATNHGGPTEIISDGVDGFLVDYHEQSDMAKKMQMLIENEQLRRDIGKRARLKQIQQFSMSSVITALEAIYNEYDKHK